MINSEKILAEVDKETIRAVMTVLGRRSANKIRGTPEASARAKKAVEAREAKRAARRAAGK